MACEVLVPPLGIEPALHWQLRSLNRWAAREVQLSALYDLPSCFSCLAALSSPQEEEEAGFTPGRRMNLQDAGLFRFQVCLSAQNDDLARAVHPGAFKNNIDCKSHASLLPGVLFIGWPDRYSVPLPSILCSDL